MIEPPPTPTAELELPVALVKCLQALDQKKAEDIRLLYVGEISSITEYFLIATGTSNPHLRALSEAATDALDELDERCEVAGIGTQSGWVVVDAYDFIIHLFTAEIRSFFNLEGLWKDGTVIKLAHIPELQSASPFQQLKRI